MLKPFRFCMLLMALVAFGLWGCSSSDDDTPTGPGGGNNTVSGPDVSAITVDVPPALQAAANANPGSGAAVAVAYITQINAVTAFVGYFNPPSPAPGIRPIERPDRLALSPNDSTTWTDGQLSVTLVTRQIEGSVITFSVRLNGSDGVTAYDNFEYISGYYFPDGSEGDFNVYHPSNPAVPITRWSWSRDPANTLSIIYEAPTSNYIVWVNIYATGAGDLSYSFNNNVQYAAVWAVDGSGSWTYYDNAGTIVDSGTWQ